MLMPDLTVLNPDTIPSVAIDFMNHTHAEEVALVRELGDLIADYQGRTLRDVADAEKIRRKLSDWLAHTQAHFLAENELMEEYAFPAYPIHAGEHAAALQKMTVVIEAWDKHQEIDLLADYVFILWPAWFNGHVTSMDMITAKFAVMNGFTPE